MAALAWFRSKPVRGNPNAVSDRVLTAAGARITKTEAGQVRRLIQPWQTRAFSYYDQLGEIKYAAQFYSRMLSPLRLYAAEKDENGDWVETENEAAIAALDRIQDPGGGRESLLGSYGRLMFLTGEAYLLVTRDAESGKEQWEVLSTDELRVQSGTYTRFRAPSLIAENYREPTEADYTPLEDDSAVAYRLWKRHPRYSMLADSTMMGVLDLCEELVLLTRAVRSRARSRLAGSGILAVAEEFSYSPLEATADEDPEVDPFLADLTAAMMAPISDEGAASAVVPLILRGPKEAIKDGLRHIQIVDPTQLYPETGLRTECIHRIALGLDMPPEILEGLQDSNHWTAWQIDEQTWKGHGQPIANQLVNDLTAAYYRPQLAEDGVTDWERYAIAYDETAIVNHPDRTKDAKDLYDRRAIGKKALRDASGFNDDDEPEKSELAEMIGVATRDSSLAWFGTPAPRGGAVEVAPGEISQASDTGGTETPPAGSSGGAEADPGIPASSDIAPDLVAAAANGSRQLALARLAGAADLALLRAREAAGNRMRSLAKRDPDLARELEGVPARLVPSIVGVERARKLGITSEVELVSAAGRLLDDTLELWGVHDEAIRARISEQIERHAARTLYDPRPQPLPPQFQTYAGELIAPTAARGG